MNHYQVVTAVVFMLILDGHADYIAVTVEVGHQVTVAMVICDCFARYAMLQRGTVLSLSRFKIA